MKAVIPVAGAGTKLRPLTYTQPKPLIPVAGKPIIAHIIDQLIEAGVDDFVFIIGHLGEKIELFVKKEYPDIKKTFVVQTNRAGLGHAIWSARESIRQAEEIVIVLGDTIFDVDLKAFITGAHSNIGIKKVDDPQQFGVVEFDHEDNINRVIEKPKIPKSNMAMVGLYKIKEVDELINAIRYNIDNNLLTHGEFQLTDGLMRMIEKGVVFKPVIVNNWFDCGKKDILLETNASLLDKDQAAQMNNNAYPSSIIIPPVRIGKNCKIEKSIIGPHVTIGYNTNISSAVIRESIIGDFTTIEEVVLQNSVIGSDAAIRGNSQSLNLGDNTEIDFS